MNWDAFLNPHFYNAGVFLKNRETGYFTDKYPDKFKIALYDTTIYNEIATDSAIVKSNSSALKPHLNRVMCTLEQENQEYIIIWEAPKIEPPEFRLYYDDKGSVITYTCDKIPGNYIVIDAKTSFMYTKSSGWKEYPTPNVIHLYDFIGELENENYRPDMKYFSPKIYQPFFEKEITFIEKCKTFLKNIVNKMK